MLDPRVREALEALGVEHDVLACDPELADTAAFCAHYGFTLDEAANTILVASKKVDPPRYAVCVVLGTTALDVNHTVRGLLDVKRLSFADADTPWNLVMVTSVLAIVPPILVVVLMQRWFVKGLVETEK